MALEDIEGPGKYINNLDRANPTATDDRSEGDNHIRGVKNCVINSLPNLTGPVLATQGELNQCVGVTSPIQTQLDAIDGKADVNAGNISVNAGNISSNTSRITQNEADILALQGVGSSGRLPMAVVSTVVDTVNSSGTYARVTGLDVTVPVGWGNGYVQVAATVNALLAISASAGIALMAADFAVYVDGVRQVDFVSAIGIQAERTNSQLLLEALVPLTFAVLANEGQVVSIYCRVNASATPGTTLTVNPLTYPQSYNSIAPIDIA